MKPCNHPRLHPPGCQCAGLPDAKAPKDVVRKVFRAGFFVGYRDDQPTSEHVMGLLIQYHLGTVWGSGKRWGMLLREKLLADELNPPLSEEKSHEETMLEL
jgi:hypothetical protein